MSNAPQDHARRILDQFTRQAASFAAKEAMSKEQTLQLLVAASAQAPMIWFSMWHADRV